MGNHLQQRMQHFPGGAVPSQGIRLQNDTSGVDQCRKPNKTVETHGRTEQSRNLQEFLDCFLSAREGWLEIKVALGWRPHGVFP